MSPDQTKQLNQHLSQIQSQLQSLQIPNLQTNDDYEANQAIADIRLKLSYLDQQLFGLYRIIDTFSPRPVRASRTPTIDDLEI